MKRLALLVPIALLFAASCQKDANKNLMGAAPTPKADVASPETPSGPPPIILTTDKSDYLPGETVIMMGHGWKPGSTVSMLLEEDPTTHDPRTFSAVVNANGDFSNSEFVVEEHDLGVLFKLTVTGDGEGGMAFFTDGGPPPTSTTLSASKTATAHYTRTFDWSIEKSVDRSSWDLFRGDAGTSEYTITVAKDEEGTDAAWLDGQICVVNTGVAATNDLQIVDSLTMPPSQTVIASVNVDVSSNPVLNPGEHGCYNYHIDIPSDDINAGDTYKNTADVTITNHSGHSGEQFGPQASASVILPASPTLINNTINVDDSNGGSFTFSASGSEAYTKTFTCDEDDGAHNNTATIRETGQSDDASVAVTCSGCTLTIGYWKTHNGLSSSLGLRDLVTALLPISLGSGGGKTVIVTTATQATSILSKEGDASNGINKLYAQLLGAKLNIKNGANGSAVASVIAAADAFLVSKNAADWNSLPTSQKNTVLSWVVALDNYNNGLTGPGHCSE